MVLTYMCFLVVSSGKVMKRFWNKFSYASSKKTWTPQLIYLLHIHHYVKSPQIRSFLKVRVFLYLVQIQENTDLRKLRIWTLFMQCTFPNTAQKMKFSINDFFSKRDQIRCFLRIWSHLLKKSLMEKFVFCTV